MNAPALAITIQYFAIFREQAGTRSESCQTQARTLAELYEQTAARHGFTLPRAQLKVAVNGEFAAWDQPVSAGAVITFIPPVAGG